MLESSFFLNKKVLITGNTGFKGSWLSVWLNLLGAKIYGLSLDPPTNPSLFEKAKLNRITVNNIIDIIFAFLNCDTKLIFFIIIFLFLCCCFLKLLKM